MGFESLIAYHSQMRRCAILIGLMASATACGCLQPKQKTAPKSKDGLFYLGDSPFHGMFGRLEEFMATHNIDWVDLGSDLGAIHVYVHGRDEGFRARELLRSYAAEESIVRWPADSMVFPSRVLVARVNFADTPSQRVLALFEDAGIPTAIFLGERTDVITTCESDKRRAVEVLRRASLPGIVVDR